MKKILILVVLALSISLLLAEITSSNTEFRQKSHSYMDSYQSRSTPPGTLLFSQHDFLFNNLFLSIIFTARSQRDYI